MISTDPTERDRAGITSGLWAAIFFSLLVAACADSHKPPQIEIEAGVVAMIDRDGGPRAELISRSERITRGMEGLQGMGFVIRSSSDEPFEVYTVHYLPGIPSRLGGAEFEGYKPQDALTGMRTKAVEVHGGRYFFWSTDESDPLGEYRIEIFVNDQLERTVRFNVVE